MRTLIFFIPYFIWACVSGRNLENARLFGSSTKVIKEIKEVTTQYPSACVQIDENLPNCRTVRYLNFLPRWGSSNEVNNDTVKLRTEPASSSILTTPLGWGEFLGIYDPTVTVFETEFITKTLLDSHVTITYAIKGCKPTKLPMELQPCSPEPPSISIEEILPTTTIHQIELATSSTPQDMNLSTPVEIQYENIENGITPPAENFLEPSMENEQANQNLQPTEPLTH